MILQPVNVGAWWVPAALLGVCMAAQCQNGGMPASHGFNSAPSSNRRRLACLQGMG
jgi:hypothetical protein